jgi:hypothetical protein
VRIHAEYKNTHLLSFFSCTLLFLVTLFCLRNFIACEPFPLQWKISIAFSPLSQLELQHRDAPALSA